MTSVNIVFILRGIRPLVRTRKFGEVGSGEQLRDQVSDPALNHLKPLEVLSLLI
ncbi:hypothetical protein DFP94_102263 [Fontibacillus phaseoli]|uniref:Uncharacterized protein n=1 Tax=Fontibacillus phaseoli TaxID=1416533 RepID=A0A369BIT9_9BACL|nr:hypothetical protein DFP94_102263 [Fontibacillus phaseoli]